MTGTEQAFDSYSGNYDAHFTGTYTGSLQRKRVWKYLKRFSPIDFSKVLELNCGTGEDAVWFAQRGFEVQATDLSGEMIALANAKAAKADLGIVLKQADIRSIASVCAGQKFNLVFSDFGGLNCLSVEELKKLSVDLKSLLLPGGKIVFVIMGRRCRWERFYFRRKGDLNRVTRREKKDSVIAAINGHEFPVWYYSPEEMVSFFSDNFQFVRKKPIGLFLPPSYLDNWFLKRRFLLALLNLAEKFFAFSSRADEADHYLLEMRVKD